MSIDFLTMSSEAFKEDVDTLKLRLGPGSSLRASPTEFMNGTRGWSGKLEMEVEANGQRVPVVLYANIVIREEARSERAQEFAPKPPTLPPT